RAAVVLVGSGPELGGGAGAFGPHVSSRLGPPQRRMKMHDFSAAPLEVLLPSTRAATIPGVARLSAPALPSWRRRRRDRVVFMWIPEGRAGGGCGGKRAGAGWRGGGGN